jgi:ankyrin repeat protein
MILFIQNYQYLQEELAIEAAHTTPLISAIINESLAAVRFLLTKGADRLQQTVDTKNALDFAAEVGNVALLEILAPQGEEVPQELLYHAILYNRHQATAYLLRRGCNSDETNKQGTTPLELAIMQRSPSLVQLLLDHSASPNKLDSDGRSPLVTALLYSKESSLALENEEPTDPQSLLAHSQEVVRILIRHPLINKKVALRLGQSILDLADEPLKAELQLAGFSSILVCSHNTDLLVFNPH